MTIYLITNTVNGKQYVGQTTQSMSARWSQHVSDSGRIDRRKGCRALHAAIAKHGAEVFSIHAMAMPEASQDALDVMETRLIAAFDCLAPKGYNLKTGGSRGKHTDEARARMSVSQRARAPITEETRAKLGAVHKGRPCWFKGRTFAEIGRVVSDEARVNMSAAQIGKPSPRRGIPQPPEWRAAISAAKKGKKRPADVIARVRAARWGNG